MTERNESELSQIRSKLPELEIKIQQLEDEKVNLSEEFSDKFKNLTADNQKINFELKTKVWRWFKDNFNVNIRVTYFDSIKALPLPLLGSSQVVEYSLKTLIFL